MKKVILGATGSIGSSLAKKLVDSGEQVHLVGRDEASLSELANELNSTFTTCDVLEENFSEKIINDLKDEQVNGLAYCVGSIDLKPLKLTKKSDFMQSFNLNLVSATEIIKSLADNLKASKGSIVLFSTVAVQQGFPNHAIVSSAKGAVEGLTLARVKPSTAPFADETMAWFGKPCCTATVENKTIDPLLAFKLSAKDLIISVAETKLRLNDCIKSLFLVSFRGLRSIDPTQ